ncbi:MAG: hypothetical protein PHQ47_03490 [Candidatus Portnoybacteria bacterium]|nr:hypothetical protein [Candidatus Portnoybacteria bacterium]
MNKEKKAWVVGVDMGYGHQRTAYPLKSFAFEEKVVNANNYAGIPDNDRNVWELARNFYEAISDFKKFPFLGNLAFGILEKFQRILSFYPKRDLSKSNFSLKVIFSFIKRGWGKDLISKLGKNPLPLVSTFFTPVFMAEVFGYPGEIYCVICDADIARTWVSPNPAKSKIKYFAPNSWVVGRLKLYGVKEENIFLTGYPLPQENTGSEKLEIAKIDLAYRLLNLDPKKIYRKEYSPLIEKYVGILPEKPDHPLTIMFSVGGAGAQKEIAVKYVRSLAQKIKNREIKVVLMAGTRKNVYKYFLDNIKIIGLEDNLDKNIEIVFADTISEYFAKFNQKLRKTDVLWTKPSELSFYTALGVPIIIAPPLGSQEIFNKRWLLRTGSAIDQDNPNYADQWLSDLLNNGGLAEAAMQGFVEAEKLGTYKIKKIVF